MDDGCTVIFSGNDDNRDNGVGFIVSKSTAKSILGYKPVNDRIAVIRLSAKPFNVSIIQVYAPTSSASDDIMEGFYGKLQETIDGINKKDVYFIVGDLNSKVRKCDFPTEHFGKFGLGNCNDRGEVLVAFCEQNKLSVMNTFFDHHPRRLYTWVSPDGRTRNQIDYILAQTRWKSSFKNVKTLPGADCGSDHQLLVGQVRLKLKVITRDPIIPRYDVTKISSTVEVSNKFEELLAVEEPVQPEELWGEMKRIMTDATAEHVPRIQKKKKSWIRDETMEIVDARKRHKEAGEHQEWNSMNRAVRKRLREDKVAFVEDMCAKLEQHADNPKELHSLIKDITRKPAPRLLVIKDPAGNVLTEDAAIKERWASYCESLYERQQDRQPVDIDTPPEQIAEQPPLREEVEQAVRLLKSGKSPGCDNVAAELWKALGEKGVDILWKLCVAIWMTGSWPEDFKCSLYITLPK